MNVNSLACSHLWSFIIVPATYLLWVYSIFAWLSAVSRCYFLQFRSESSGIWKFSPWDVQLHQKDANALFRSRKSAQPYINSSMNKGIRSVFYSCDLPWPRRPPTVTSKSIATAYAIICLLPFSFGRHSSATGQRLRKLFIWQWSCRSLLWSSWISSKSTILQFSWPPDAMTLLPVSKIHESEHGGRSMSCAFALYLQKSTNKIQPSVFI